jgi:hypothetical protein
MAGLQDKILKTCRERVEAWVQLVKDEGKEPWQEILDLQGSEAGVFEVLDGLDVGTVVDKHIAMSMGLALRVFRLAIIGSYPVVTALLASGELSEDDIDIVFDDGDWKGE